MISSAIPLVQSLDAIAKQTENRNLREAVRKISSDIQTGISLAEALFEASENFQPALLLNGESR